MHDACVCVLCMCVRWGGGIIHEGGCYFSMLFLSATQPLHPTPRASHGALYTCKRSTSQGQGPAKVEGWELCMK
jgi:hypothetical protein